MRQITAEQLSKMATPNGTLEMKAAPPQSHLGITIKDWTRLQEMVKDGEVEIDGSKLDVPGVVAVAK